jgi:hypothetical protein
MGLFDEISGYVNCPYCGHKQYTVNQTKKLFCEMKTYEPGQKISGGPFLNGEYSLYHKIECEVCKTPFQHSFTIKDQIITRLDSYTTEDFKRKDFVLETNMNQFLDVIKKNCITTILMTINLTAAYDYDAHCCEYNKHYHILLDYLDGFKRKFHYVNTSDLLNSIFDDLEESVNIQYLEEINIEFDKFYHFKFIEKDTKEMIDGYGDLITLLKQTVIENKNLLRNQIADYLEN